MTESYSSQHKTLHRDGDMSSTVPVGLAHPILYGIVRVAFFKFAILLNIFGCVPSNSIESIKDVSITPPKLNLGTVEHGDVATGRFTIHNSTDSTIAIERFDVSCPCVHIAGAEKASIRIGRQEEFALEVQFDSKIEPGFRGNLIVKVEGVEPSGRVVLKANVLVTVK